ncbi:MAG: hypothetical protein ACK517_03305 [bacterium]
MTSGGTPPWPAAGDFRERKRIAPLPVQPRPASADQTASADQPASDDQTAFHQTARYRAVGAAGAAVAV